MKKTLLFLPFFLSAFLSFSQDTLSSKRDTTRIRMGKSTILIINDTLGKGKYDHDLGSCNQSCNKEGKNDAAFIMDIGLNGYRTPDYKLSLPPSQKLMEINYSRSRSFGLSVLSRRGASLIKDRLYLTSGLGVSWNSYLFENNISISTNNDSTSFALDTIVEYNKYKLRTTFIELPLIVGVRIGNLNHPLGLHLGVIGGFNINTIIKQKYSLEGVDYKVKVKDDFNTNPLRLDAVARLTYGNTGFFVRYSFTTLFEKDKAPDLYPFSAGITIGQFHVKRKTK